MKENTLKLLYKKIEEGIRNGIIQPNGNIRQYDILDYYEELINFDLLNIGINTKVFESVISAADYRILRKFITNNFIGEVLNEKSINQVFSTKEEYNTLRDEKGFPIPGTGQILSTEEKYMIFNYIKEKKLPMTSKFYSLVKKRYTDGELSLENIEEKTRKM